MTMNKTRDVLADLHRARHILAVMHAKADGKPIRIKAKELPAIRAAWAAVEVAIESASVPLDAPDTVVGDYRPTMYAPEYARTELATTFEAR